ncbi:terminase small subunit, partial [Cetobacterium sp.]|uniref:terminase small subunit n=1 Tax=Cetobacterium sp. TaxID=2071632 RepID=UPI003AF107D1
MRDKAKDMYEAGFGSLRKIAEELNVPEATVKSWKQRSEIPWINPKKKDASKIKKDASKKKIAFKVEKVGKEEIIETLADSELTDKQRLFCIYYMQSFNATKAATKAGYSRETAMEQGCRLLRNVKVKEYLTELKEMYAQDDYLETKRLLDRHKQIAFADIKDFTEFQIEKVFMDYDEETGKPIFEKRFQFRIKDDVDVDGTLIKKIGMGKFGPVIELEDRAKSLDLLNKVYGLDPSFQIQIEKINLEKNKIKVLEDRNRII